jgi:hypothetical protein
VLLLLSVASGCFFQMSEKMITGLVQYLPQGWTLAALRGTRSCRPGVRPG